MVSQRYTLDRVLGQGGLGVVYAATDHQTGETVALKVPSPGENKKYAVARFESEASHHRLVKHDNIVKVLDVGKDASGHPYMVLEYIEGISLSELIKQRAPLPLPEVLDMLLQICDALEAVHGARLVHRDLKAANIMVVENEDGSRKIKLLDFGIVKAIDDAITLTAPSSFVGTPHYISPEEIQDANVDGRADLYATGVLLYRMATRRFPYRGKPVQVLHATLHHRPASFKRVAPDLDLPLELQRIAYRCLEKSPSDRYATAEELAADLRDLQSLEDDTLGVDLGTLKPHKLITTVTPVPPVVRLDDPEDEDTEQFAMPVSPQPHRGPLFGLALAAVALLTLGGLGLNVVWSNTNATPLPTPTVAQADAEPAAADPAPIEAASPATPSTGSEASASVAALVEDKPATDDPAPTATPVPAAGASPKPAPVVAKTPPARKTQPAPSPTPKARTRTAPKPAAAPTPKAAPKPAPAEGTAEALPSKVHITAAVRSMVTIEGQAVGHTPVTIQAGLGTYNISVAAPDQAPSDIRRVAVDGSGAAVKVHFD